MIEMIKQVCSSEEVQYHLLALVTFHMKGKGGRTFRSFQHRNITFHKELCIMILKIHVYILSLESEYKVASLVLCSKSWGQWISEPDLVAITYFTQQWWSMSTMQLNTILHWSLYNHGNQFQRSNRTVSFKVYRLYFSILVHS